VLFGKTTPYGKIFKNSVAKGFIATSMDVLCPNFVKAGRREIGEIVRCLPDKKNKISPGSPALATARIAPRMCQGQPPTMYSECSRFRPNWFAFGGAIAERVNTVKTHRTFALLPSALLWPQALARRTSPFREPPQRFRRIGAYVMYRYFILIVLVSNRNRL